MNEPTRAQRAIVRIGSMELEGFMLPDGSYVMSQAQAAEAIGTSKQNASNFLRSKTLKSLLGEGYTHQTSEVEPAGQVRGQTRIQAIPLPVVNAFWQWQSHRGNKQAFSITFALSLESLERRFDAAFGVQVSETERDRRLAERIGEVERMAGEAFAEADNATQERNYFLKLLQDAGIDPWSLPNSDQ